MTDPIIAVFDTNVLISAEISRGPPFRCIELVRNGRVRGVTCREILSEFHSRLQRRPRLTPDEAADALASIAPYLELVQISGALRGVVARDQDDDMVVECAVVANATHIVTGDSHLLSIGKYAEISIVSPAEFLILAGQDNPA